MIDHLMYKPPLKNTSWVTLISGDKHGLNMISGENHELKFTWEVISIFFPSGSALKWMFNTSGRQYKEAIGT